MSDDERSSSLEDQSNLELTERTINLLDLPVEIILHICSYLDASTLVHGMSLVCKHFYAILNDDSMWKSRISQIWPNTSYPPLQPVEEEELFWKLSCVSIERQAKLWGKKDSMETMYLDKVHFCFIDAVLLLQKGSICISGSRDRSLVLWRLPNKEYGHQQESLRVPNAHDGWIWDLTAIDNVVYSCAWDKTVKAWDLANTGLIHSTTYDTAADTALLSITSCPQLNLFAAGSFCSNVLVFDSREGTSPIVKYKAHHRAVLRLAMNSNYILSVSEDKTVIAWDQRARRVLNKITIAPDSFGMSICMRDNIVYVGDSKAKLHILDPKRNFDRVKSYNTEHDLGITGVHCDSGCLITSSKDKSVRIMSPTDPPQSLAMIHSQHGEIASIDYLNEVLAISGIDSIEIWRPKVASRYS